MIEYYTCPIKRVFLKAVSITLVISFMYQQVVWATDLQMFTRPHTGVPSEQMLPSTKEKISEKTAIDLKQEKKKGSKEEGEVTNYNDLMNNITNQIKGKKDKEATAKFAPYYIQKAQQQREDVMKNKQQIDDAIKALRLKLDKALYGVGEDEDDLKKKGRRGGGEQPSYTLTDPTQEEDEIAHNLNEYKWNADQLNSIVKFDVTRINIDKWLKTAQKKTDDSGKDYWVSFEALDLSELDPDRKVQTAIYFKDGDENKISAIYWGYKFDSQKGEYVAKYKSEYVYSGSDLKEIRVYDISNGEDSKVLREKSVFTKVGDKDKIQKTVYYMRNGSTIYLRRDYEYQNGALKKVLTYETDSEEMGTGTLKSETLYTGKADEEKADITYNYKYYHSVTDNEVSETTIYWYKGGKRAGEAGKDDPLEKSVTYWGKPTINEDGSIAGDL